MKGTEGSLGEREKIRKREKGLLPPSIFDPSGLLFAPANQRSFLPFYLSPFPDSLPPRFGE
jgi:hypothetical protein